MDREMKERELQQLKQQVRTLEQELDEEKTQQQWPPKDFYLAYHVLAGFVLGICGAATSLLFNIVGSLLFHQNPLRIIQVYLTFPLGEQALHIDNSLTLAIGCCLYLATGMILGIPFQLVLRRWFADSSFKLRFGVVTVMALALWIINFYGILSWLQPLVVDGRAWILEEMPWWVGATTHLVFGWTMLLVEPYGKFVPIDNPTEVQ